MKLARLRLISTALSLLLLETLFVRSSFAQRPLGLDISSYQGASVNWASISNAGYQFGWVKAGEATSADGYTNPDPDYHGNMSKAKAVGTPVGPYYFAHPDLDAPLTASASFWGIAGPDILADNKSFSPMLDMEVFNGVTTAASYSDWINQWASNVVSRAKSNSVTIKPAIYFSACKGSYFTSAISIWVNDVANYGSVNGGNDPQTGTPWSSCSSDNPWGGTVWQFWQYESVGSVPSITGNVDLDVFNGTSTSLQAYVNKNPAGTQAPANITLYWDANGHHAVPGGGGSGNWSTNDANWFYTGTSNYAWNAAGDNPIFAGTSGTVTLASAVKAGTLTFSTGNYTITGTSQTLTLTNSSAYLTMPSILPETISCIFAGSGYTVPTNGFLILNNSANSMNGPIYLGSNSTLQIALAHSVGFGIFTITVSNGATLYNADVTSNDLFLSPGLTVYMAPGAGYIKQTPATTLGMLATISGPGDFIKQGIGARLNTFVSNTCTGRAIISQGTFALGSGSSLNNVSAVSILPNATFDVSPVSTSWTMSTNTILEASGTGTNGTAAATLKGSSNIYLGSQPIMLTYTPTSTNGDASHPALYVSQGTLVLTSSNQVTVTNAAANALAPGDYVLVQQATNAINGSALPSVVVTGAGLQVGTSAVVNTVSNLLIMTVASNTSLVLSLVSNAVYGQPVTLTATTTPVLSDGTVQFYNNAVAIGSPVAVVSGTASITVSNLPGGSDVITAYYNAPTNYSGSSASGVGIYVSQAISTNALVSSENPALPGDSVTFTSTISTLAPSTAMSYGTVQFQLDGSPLGSLVTLSNGVASSAAVTNLSHGYHTNEADFAGDSNIAGSTNWLVELINTAPVANPASYVRSPDIALNIAISDLLTHASDADGDAVTLSGVDTVSSNGGTITTNATTITYTQAATNGDVSDTFSYVVSDIYGATATNVVSITVSNSVTPPPTSIVISGFHMNADGTMQMNFTGAPGSNYLIQAATDLTNPLSWSNLGNITADTNGGFFFLDSTATNFRTHYYRAASQ